MIRRPPRSTRTDTLFPYTTLFRSLRKQCIKHPTTQLFPIGILSVMIIIIEMQRSYSYGRLIGFRIRTVRLIPPRWKVRSEEHTSELQSLMRISYAVFCLKKKNIHTASSLYHY